MYVEMDSEPVGPSSPLTHATGSTGRVKGAAETNLVTFRPVYTD